MTKIIKIIVYNLIFLILLLVIGDLTLGHLLNDPVKYMCKDKRLHHIYCPESERVYRMENDDGGKVFRSYWNKQGLRVKFSNEKGDHINTSTFDMINIGDSFMAQRQVEYEDRVSSFVSRQTSLKVLQVGVGSWSVVNYRNWIEDNKLGSGVIVNVFIMANDLYPFGYGMSNYMYHKYLENENGKLIWKDSEEKTNYYKRFLINNSFIYHFFNEKVISQDYSKIKSKYEAVKVSFDTVQNDCDSLPKKGKYTPYAYSHIIMAFERKCWPEEMENNYRVTIEDLTSIIEKVSDVDGKVNVYMIPNGWAMKNEVLAGKQHPTYQIGKDVTITMNALVKVLKNDLNISVVSLEDYFKQIKQTDSRNLYYPYDAHWNKLGSEYVAKKIISDLSN